MREIQYEVADRVARIRINRPEAKNAMSVAMLIETQDRIYEAQVDPSVHTLVITGNGDNLTAGFDLKEVPGAKGSIPVQQHFRKTSLYWHSIMHSLVRIRKPVIVGAQGMNIAGAIGFMAVSDFTIVSDDCRVSPAWISIGICPDASSTYHLPRMIGLRRAIEWIVTNHVATAEEMLAWGFVNRVVPRAELDAAVVQLARSLTAIPADLLGETKFLMHQGTTNTIEEQTEWEREGVLRSVGSDNMLARWREFMNKVRPAVREVAE